MNVEEIGVNAGKVWQALSNGLSSVKDVKKATKLNDKQIFAAIGWLAREGKLNVSEADKEVFINLI